MTTERFTQQVDRMNNKQNFEPRMLNVQGRQPQNQGYNTQQPNSYRYAQPLPAPSVPTRPQPQPQTRTQQPIQAAPLSTQTQPSQSKGAPTPIDPNAVLRQGLEEISNIASGDSPNLDRLLEKYLNRGSNVQAAQQAGMQQQFNQAGLDPTQSATLSADAQRRFNMQQGETTGQIAQEQGREQFQAIQQLPQLAQQAQQMDILKKQDLQNQFNKLIELGGSKNLMAAEKIGREVFGVDTVDMHKIEEIGINRMLADYASMPGFDVNEAVQLMKGNGELDYLGITEEEAKAKLEPIYQNNNPLSSIQTGYQNMLDQGLISQNEYDNAMAVQKFNLLNPQGLEINDSFLVVDSAGNEIGNFLDEGEAIRFSQQHGGSIQKGKMVNLAGETPENLPSEGEVFTDKGSLYIVEGGQKVLAKPDFDDPFSSQNRQILNYYKDHPNADKTGTVKDIIDTQTKHIMNNPNDLDMISSYDDPIYNEVIRRKGLTNYSDLANLNKDETGTGSGSKITIPEFENMPPDKLITVTDPTGRKVIVRFDGKGVHDAVGDNKSWYKFVDPISGREVTIETSRDKSSKQKSAVVWSEATNTNNTNENDSNNGNVNSRLGRKKQ